jgi:lipopolysaccharide/colanic/teichoic acid biosynthesis glycosyltransferase
MRFDSFILFASKKRSLFPNDIPIWKRTLDILFILAVLPVLVPLISLIALGIRIVSRGPVLFRQERIGYRGKPFCFLKFRSMRVDADSGVHQKHLEHLMQADVPMKKMDLEGDSRLIPFGSFLRATGLDELPQLVNVFCGDMSIVGPRPCTFYEYERYLPWHKHRFDTVPGLTGLWQVSGKNKTTFTEMVSMDIAYADNKSLWLDLRIILKTAPALIEQVKELATKRLLGVRTVALQTSFNRSSSCCKRGIIKL